MGDYVLPAKNLFTGSTKAAFTVIGQILMRPTGVLSGPPRDSGMAVPSAQGQARSVLHSQSADPTNQHFSQRRQLLRVALPTLLRQQLYGEDAVSPLAALRRRSSMHARVSSYQSPSEQLTDDAIANVKANFLPRVLEMDGNRGAILLMDRDSGKTISITLWESEEAMRASEEEANQVRGDAAQTTSGNVGGVERFEVPVAELR